MLSTILSLCLLSNVYSFEYNGDIYTVDSTAYNLPNCVIVTVDGDEIPVTDICQ